MNPAFVIISATVAFLRSLLPERIYSTALIAAWSLTLGFGLLVINVVEFRPYAMTVGSGLITTFLAVAIVFAGRKTSSTRMFRPIDINFLGMIVPVIIIVRALLFSTLLGGDFVASALEGLIGSTIAGVGVGIMAFAKKDAD